MASDRQFRQFPEYGDQLESALREFEPAPGEVRDLVEIRSTQVGDLSVLEIAQDILNRIEFRCVGRQVVKDDTIALGLDEFEHQSALVGFESVPNYQQLALDLTRECAQKLDQLRGLDAAGEEPEVEVPESHDGNFGDLLPGEVVLQHRRLSLGRPGTYPGRPFVQSRFVDEDDGAPLAPSFF